MNLIIVESPTKARTLSRFLGSDYQIEASMGHIVDLPKSTLGVDVEHNFAPEFVTVKGKEAVINTLRTVAKKADTIILATDPDREGEAIASHVKDVLGAGAYFQRIAFHEITKEAIDEAIKNPRDIDGNLVDAQTARRVLDRLVGYKLSPLLWKKVRRGLSAGRVQSVAVRLIVEREREIEKFDKKKYWTISAIFKEIPFELVEISGEKIEEKETFQLYDGDYTASKTLIDTQEKADKILQDLRDKQFTVADVLQKEVKRSPAPSFTTSTLQQNGAHRLGWSGKKTMSVAQKLYEEGFITYHRTDSVAMANQAVFAIRSFIEKEYGQKYVNSAPRMFKTKQKLAQEAHEAIRPTNISHQPSAISHQLGGDYGRLYELIWRRAVATQMSDAVIESTAVYADGGIYRFKTTGSVLVFDGFLKINPQALEDKKLPKFEVSERLNLLKSLAEMHEMQPPPRYNYASLVATLEEKGIGRPSTYAPIVSTIEDRRYIELQEGRFVPTPVGVAVNDFLVTNFADIDNIPFTAEMEDSLDSIAHGKKEWVPMIAQFYKPFEKKVEEVEDAKRVKIAVEKSSEICEKCGSPMVVRMGRFGRFLSCSRFPDCDFKKAIMEKTDLLCPKDNGAIIIKKTRRGRRFYGCSNYPNCKFAAWKLEEIKNAK
ncbi:type I DNA topoisomerase [Candidatus Microgenomates bacterium]|nr:type I DNA topoisomerase [Candidatus Microgenomates bacterium]